MKKKKNTQEDDWEEEEEEEEDCLAWRALSEEAREGEVFSPSLMVR